MHFTGFVAADEPAKLMRSLIHQDGDSPAEVWVPLDVAGPGRCGWQQVSEADSRYPEEDWVHCAWPTPFLRKTLGPYAILGDEGIATRGVSREFVKRRNGVWQAKIPRFFDTIGDHWSIERRDDRFGLVTKSGSVGGIVMIEDLDLERSLEKAGPCLLVGPQGPLFYDEGFRSSRESFLRRRREAAQAFLDLPSDMCVLQVDWHG